jgi:hypothetical protein
MKIKTRVTDWLKKTWKKIKEWWKNSPKLHFLEKGYYFFMIAGFVFGLWQYMKNSEDNIRSDTIQYLVGFSELLGKIDPALIDTLNFYGHRTDYNALSVDALRQLLSSNIQYRRQINNVMYYLNQLAIGCENNFFDEKTVYLSDRYDIIYVTNALTPYFEIRNDAEGIDTKKGNTVCFYLRNMVDRWKTKAGECGKWRMEDSERIGQLKEELINMQAIAEKKKKGVR